jgi:hypothetical protein
MTVQLFMVSTFVYALALAPPTRCGTIFGCFLGFGKQLGFTPVHLRTGPVAISDDRLYFPLHTDAKNNDDFILIVGTGQVY